MEIIRNLSKQSFPAGSGRITLKNSLGDYLHLLKSPDFKLLVFKCAGSYSPVFTVQYSNSVLKCPTVFKVSTLENQSSVLYAGNESLVTTAVHKMVILCKENRF